MLRETPLETGRTLFFCCCSIFWIVGQNIVFQCGAVEINLVHCGCWQNCCYRKCSSICTTQETLTPPPPPLYLRCVCMYHQLHKLFRIHLNKKLYIWINIFTFHFTLSQQWSTQILLLGKTTNIVSQYSRHNSQICWQITQIRKEDA